MSTHRRNSARDKVIGKKQIYEDRMLVREANRQERKLFPEDLVAHSFIIQGEWGLEKPASSFLGVVAPSQYQVRCIQIRRRVVLKLLPLV